MASLDVVMVMVMVMILLLAYLIPHVIEPIEYFGRV